MAFQIIFSPEARGHLKAFPKNEQKIILEGISDQLQFQPTVETRQRKLLRPNPLAPWELRIGDFRAFYDIELKPPKVIIIAVGKKEHNRLIIGNEEVFL